MSVEVNDRKEAQRNYSETREWQSELNSLVIDLQFYQRMVDIYGLKANDAIEKHDVNLLKETLSSFIQHRVENQKNRLKMHEEYLQKVAEDRVLLKDRELPFKHKDMLEEMLDFRVAGNGLKNELFNKQDALQEKHLDDFNEIFAFLTNGNYFDYNFNTAERLICLINAEINRLFVRIAKNRIKKIVCNAIDDNKDITLFQIDHIDNNKLNNNIENLRVATQQQNMWNKNCKGYSFDKKNNKWRVRISVDGKSINGGYFNTEEEAIKKRAELKNQYHNF